MSYLSGIGRKRLPHQARAGREACPTSGTVASSRGYARVRNTGRASLWS